MGCNKNKRPEGEELRPYKAKFAQGAMIQCKTLHELNYMIKAHLARAKKYRSFDSLIEKTMPKGAL